MSFRGIVVTLLQYKRFHEELSDAFKYQATLTRIQSCTSITVQSDRNQPPRLLLGFASTFDISIKQVAAVGAVAETKEPVKGAGCRRGIDGIACETADVNEDRSNPGRMCRKRQTVAESWTTRKKGQNEGNVVTANDEHYIQTSFSRWLTRLDDPLARRTSRKVKIESNGVEVEERVGRKMRVLGENENRSVEKNRLIKIVRFHGR